MKLKKSLILAAGVLAVFSSLHAETVISASNADRLNGRVQYGDLPGAGAGSLKFVDQALPQREIRVGPSREQDVGLGFLIAFETDDNTRNQLMMASKVELVLDVLGLSLGGPPSALQVDLLTTEGGSTAAEFAQFGAWNDARQHASVGSIPADARIGLLRIDVTEALHEALPPSSRLPNIFFGIYAPLDDLASVNEGRHILFRGEGERAPRLILSY